MASVKRSEYVLQLSAQSRQRYEEKLNKVGLTSDPYCLENSEWEKNPEELPLLTFSDVMMFMVATPSPYTKESIKVHSRTRKKHNIYLFKCRHGREC